MLILGIETSCDETAAAIIEDGTKIISNVKATTLDANRAFGGVVPDKTAREQLKLILPVIAQAVEPIGGIEKIDAIAVTRGPGLIGSLLIGVETAKTLAYSLNKSIVPVNHLVGHIYANWLETTSPPKFPALALLVSGAHSDLILMTAHGKFKLLGSTRDDAAGECFDKCGRVLGLEYPYGPYIETEAEKYTGAPKITLPRPLLNQKNYDFSFSGLKTAFLREFQKGQPKTALAYELQEAVTDVLVAKFVRAATEFKTKSLLLAGGVAANKCLRSKLQSKFSKIFIPPISLCTDNATYIAAAAYFNYKPVPWAKINADPSLTITSR